MTLAPDKARPAKAATAPKRKSLLDSPVFLKISGVLGVLLVLEALTRLNVIPNKWFPPVSEFIGRFVEMLGTSALWSDIANTMLGWMIGLTIAAVLAIPIGMLIGSQRVLEAATRAVIEFLRPVPSVALIPLAVLLWGIDLETKVFLVAFASFWPILFQAIYGVQSVDPQQIQVIRVYRLGRLAAFRHIVIPSTLPYIATGIRISSSIALALSITAEIVVGAPGLGRSIMLAQQSSLVTDMYALIIAAGLLGWLMNSLLRFVEAKVLHWHQSYREGSAA